MPTLERLKAVGGGGVVCENFSKGRKTVHCAAFLMQMYLRQHGLMSFTSLNIPEREINLH
jgi:hypothetical protein